MPDEFTPFFNMIGRDIEKQIKKRDEIGKSVSKSSKPQILFKKAKSSRLRIMLKKIVKNSMQF